MINQFNFINFKIGYKKKFNKACKSQIQFLRINIIKFKLAQNNWVRIDQGKVF